MQQAGDIYIDTYSGWYSVRDEAYYGDEETVVDEDNVRRGRKARRWSGLRRRATSSNCRPIRTGCSRFIGTSRIHGPDSRRNEVVSFVKGGLRDLSISRTTFDGASSAE